VVAAIVIYVNSLRYMEVPMQSIPMAQFVGIPAERLWSHVEALTSLVGNLVRVQDLTCTQPRVCRCGEWHFGVGVAEPRGQYCWPNPNAQPYAPMDPPVLTTPPSEGSAEVKACGSEKGDDSTLSRFASRNRFAEIAVETSDDQESHADARTNVHCVSSGSEEMTCEYVKSSVAQRPHSVHKQSRDKRITCDVSAATRNILCGKAGYGPLHDNACRTTTQEPLSVHATMRNECEDDAASVVKLAGSEDACILHPLLACCHSDAEDEISSGETCGNKLVLTKNVVAAKLGEARGLQPPVMFGGDGALRRRGRHGANVGGLEEARGWGSGLQLPVGVGDEDASRSSAGVVENVVANSGDARGLQPPETFGGEGAFRSCRRHGANVGGFEEARGLQPQATYSETVSKSGEARGVQLPVAFGDEDASRSSAGVVENVVAKSGDACGLQLPLGVGDVDVSRSSVGASVVVADGEECGVDDEEGALDEHAKSEAESMQFFCDTVHDVMLADDGKGAPYEIDQLSYWFPLVGLMIGPHTGRPHCFCEEELNACLFNYKRLLRFFNPSKDVLKYACRVACAVRDNFLAQVVRPVKLKVPPDTVEVKSEETRMLKSAGLHDRPEVPVGKRRNRAGPPKVKAGPKPPRVPGSLDVTVPSRVDAP
jgi:hypothetical protein